MIYLTGDVHGQLDIDKLTRKQFPQQDVLTRGDYLIQLGDLGLLWQHDKTYKYLMDFWTTRKYTLLWIDGNHESFSWLNTFPKEEWNGGMVHRIAPNILHLMRGQIFEIDGQTFLTIGGAASVDKEQRQAYISWWPEEEPNGSEQAETFHNLERHGWTVDYVLSHAAPAKVLPQIFSDAPRYPITGTEQFLEAVRSMLVDYRRWYFGHYHRDTCWYKFYCLYNKVTTLEQLWVKGVDF